MKGKDIQQSQRL